MHFDACSILVQRSLWLSTAMSLRIKLNRSRTVATSSFFGLLGQGQDREYTLNDIHQVA